ncbi:arylesterase [Oleomonas cavernae]|uniref:arylesterase n=1 Tax=Oleomonas cavernae TaxID=2320859 RepID=UPI001F469C0A|nr:arylesterase [Oleomonas cavernae]
MREVAPASYGLKHWLFNLMLLAGLVFSMQAQAKDYVVVAFGTSLSHGFGLPEAEIFPVQLQKALAAKGLAVTVQNAGVSGDTTAGGLARLDWALGDPATPPDLVIVEFGGNDALRALSPQEAEANLDQILTRLQARHIKVLFTGMKAPPNLGSDYVAAFDAIYPRLAQKHGVPFYPFFLDGVAADPALNQADGIHPNAKGVAIIVGHLAPSSSIS